MSFTYIPGTPIYFVRLLISDTQNVNHVFEDDEITTFMTLTSQVWQSSMFWSGFQGSTTLPSTPVNYLRAAALALDSLAANKSRLASIKQLLDVKLDSSDAAIQLRLTAQEYRNVDDDSMAFVIFEQVHNDWSFRDRFWSQWQRSASM